MTYLPIRVLKALEFAAVAHKNQYRKFPAHVPYFTHLAIVCLTLSAADYPEDVIVAGALHDLLEDTPKTIEDIKKEFGKKVAGFVLAVTEHKKLPWKERKEKYLEQLSKASAEAKAISAADLLANRTSNLVGLRRGENPWIKFATKNPEEYARRIFEIDRKRLKVIKQGAVIPFIVELEENMDEVEKLSWELLKQD